MPNISPERFSRLRQLSGYNQPQMGRYLGITGKYLGMIERGDKEVAEESSLGLLFRMLEEAGPPKEGTPEKYAPLMVVENEGPAGRATRLHEDSPVYGTEKPPAMIPVIGWAHAGEAASYEEIPHDWQIRVPTECRDPKAFAVTLEGESMEPKYSPGDMLILQPSKEPFSGCLAVCRFKDDGVVFRRVEFMPEEIRLIALNPSYPTTSHSRDSFAWIYPLWGRWTQVWK